MHRAAYGGHDRPGIGGGANDDRDSPATPKRRVDLRPHRAREIVRPDVFDDADHFRECVRVAGGLHLQPLSNRIASGPCARGERLVDDDHVLSAVVVVVEWPAGDESRPHGPEVRRRHVPAVRRFALPSPGRHFVVGKRGERSTSCQGQLRDQPDVGDAGDGAQPSFHFLEQGRPQFGARILCRRQGNSERQQAGRIESGADALQRGKAPDRQPGADQEDERQRHFGDHQQPAATCGRDRSGTGAEHTIQVDLRGPESGQQSKRECGQRCGRHGEEQHRRVDTDGIETRQVRRVQPCQCHGADPGEKHTDRSAGGGKHETLRCELPDQAKPRRTERATNRHLTFARGRPREEQVRDVGTRNDEHESNRNEERQQSAAGVLHHIFLERDDPDVHVGGLVLGVLGAKLARDPAQIGLRLIESDARCQPAEHGEEGEVSRRTDSVIELQRLPDLRVGDQERLGRQPEMKILRHDPDDGLIEAIESNPFADHLRVRAVAAFPQPETEDHDAGPADALPLPAGSAARAADRRRAAERNSP